MPTDLDINHWTVPRFTQRVTAQQRQEIADKRGAWVWRRGKRALITTKRIAPGRYALWLEDEHNAT